MSALLLAAFAWFAEPAPLEMPRAEAYLATEKDGKMRLVDKYDTLDLWTAREVAGRWTDSDGRVFLAAEIDAVPPDGESTRATLAAYDASIRPVTQRDKDKKPLAKAISLLSPVEPAEEPSKPRHSIHGMRETLYWHGTNESAIVATFTPENTRRIFFISWELAPGDDFAAALESLEDGVIREWDKTTEKNIPSLSKNAFSTEDGKPREKKKTERDLLRQAIAHSVANYGSWRATDAEDFTIIDDLGGSGAFPAALSNEFSRMRPAYAKAFPTPLDVSDSLAAARIFRGRAEYLNALEINDTEGMEWSAAYWSPERRELVAYLPPDGEAALLKTIRHEAFHQYLSYACSMISASPWINEGYAQYFEDETSADWGIEVDVEQLSARLPAVLGMDYEAFYDPVPEIRLLNYRTAWSIARFLETGARKVRHDPFKDLKADYVKALLATKDMKKATAAAFGDASKLKLFVTEWEKYWKNNM